MYGRVDRQAGESDESIDKPNRYPDTPIHQRAGPYSPIPPGRDRLRIKRRTRVSLQGHKDETRSKSHTSRIPALSNSLRARSSIG